MLCIDTCMATIILAQASGGVRTLGTTAQDVWSSIALYLPRIGSALLVLVIGWIAASLLAGLIRRLLGLTKIDESIERTTAVSQLERGGMKIRISNILASIVKWFVLIVTFISVSEILGIQQLTQFLRDVALYIPNVLIAIIILAVGFIVGGFMQKVVRQAIGATRLASASADLLGGIARWAIIVFAFLAALIQLQIATSLIQILFTGFVAMVSLAAAIAFGLGGRDQAAHWLERLDSEIRQQTGPPRGA
jgi:hypothetical protein